MQPINSFLQQSSLTAASLLFLFLSGCHEAGNNQATAPPKWYLFYHDVQLSGKTHLRNVKVTALKYNSDGSIQPVTAKY